MTYAVKCVAERPDALEEAALEIESKSYDVIHESLLRLQNAETCMKQATQMLCEHLPRCSDEVVEMVTTKVREINRCCGRIADAANE